MPSERLNLEAGHVPTFVGGGALAATSGTLAGLVKDINPGAGSSFPGFLADVNGTLFFRGG